MHNCLRISEILHLIFGFVTSPWNDGQLDGWTLASLARTCQLFSSPALDVLWHDLPSFKPLLDVFPITASSMDNAQWLTFRKYAVRVKIVHGVEDEALLEVKEEFISAVQHCPPAYLPLLPNLTKLEWEECGADESVFSVLRYFASPAVTTIMLSLMSRVACSSAEWDAFMDLPRVCPNVTSFTITPNPGGWYHEPSQEVGRMVAQWPRLKILRACPIPQSVMDQLFSRQTLETLCIICDKSPPIYNGRIPDTVRELTLNVTSPSMCTRFFDTAHASPTRFSLFIGTKDVRQDDQGTVVEMLYLLPRHLDPFRLLSLTIQPEGSRTFHMPLSPLVSMIVEFTALCELDLDHLSTVQMTNVEYARIARSVPHLRSLKLGTAYEYTRLPEPNASVEAVIAVLTYCEHLETLRIMFNRGISPPAPLGELASQGWGVSNRHITELFIGQQPIANLIRDGLMTCLKSIMPYLVRVGSSTGWWEIKHVHNTCTHWVRTEGRY